SDIAPPQQDAPAPQQEASAPPAAAEPPTPVSAERHIPKAHTMPSRHAAPATPPLHDKRRVAKPAAERQTPAPAPKKTAHEDRGAKQTDEALNAVRKFQDNLRDIPVSSYASDGTRRTIVIRPSQYRTSTTILLRANAAPLRDDPQSPFIPAQAGIQKLFA